MPNSDAASDCRHGYRAAGGSFDCPACSTWLMEGTPEQIVLGALQRIAFEDVDDPRELAQDALHGAGFASMKVVYSGSFDLAWLKDGERVMSAGDGTGAALIVGPEGERRLNVGDEVRL